MASKFMSTVSAWRLLAVCLLAICVCFGPGRFGASVALAAAPECDSSCPCARASAGEHAQAHAALGQDDTCAGASEGSQYLQADPCHDDCSERCPTCACRLGAAMAVLPLAQAAHTAAWSFASNVVRVARVACGSRTRVFRPPRALG
ncbi:MAG TPA: hypothetical protein VFU02_07700 [Polyangiaceae bacterium]|nr:hypothetical protein [Polyangiaceae bacterium]